MNGEACCILGVCCPPRSQEQADALAHEMVVDRVCVDQKDARRVAKWMLKHFDLAPQGTLAPLVREIARMARDKGKGPK